MPARGSSLCLLRLCDLCVDVFLKRLNTEGTEAHRTLRIRLAGLALLAALLCPATGVAQSDYRNLDAGRPIAVEDAQPVEYRALESTWGIPRFLRERRGAWLVGAETEFKWGIYKDLQFGLASEYVIVREDGDTIVASRDKQAHLLWNFNAEGPRMPAIALRPSLSIRSGGLGSQHEHGALKLIMSKTIRRNRLHFNGAYTIGPTEAPGRGGELVNRYFYGAAYERTLPLKFMVLLAGVHVTKPIDHSKAEVVLEGGTRIQLTPNWVLDAGVSTGAVRDGGHDFGFTFGLSRSFSFRWLYPKGDRP